MSKATKRNYKWWKQVHFIEKGNPSCNNAKNKSDQKIYASTARMSDNNEFPRGNFGDSSQFTNLILDSGGTCHMNPEVLDFIPG